MNACNILKLFFSHAKHTAPPLENTNR